ncbi:exonuclease domain-containing protein [Allomuricauda sp. d1]|uniref:exonuclease domain-containing protein n=1 Tax=Allomuricauda sp. d1 TaxID=3136725 RepID=UPI0031E3B6D0
MYAILDIESTGGKYNQEGIMEIAIHRFDGHKVVDKFISLVNPEREIQAFVTKLTGINNKMLRTAPKFHEVAKRIIEITENAVLVAHNAQFDYRILRTEFRRLGYDFQRKTLCTVDLSQQLIPEAESHSLGKLVRSLGIAVSDRHRANGDALATLKLFKLLLAKDVDKSIIKSVIREETHGELSPRQLDIIESLPTETGIYYMHDKDGEIIFLGKSKNIKRKANQHFISPGKLGRSLQKETKKISFELTGSELVAHLKEYQEIKKNKPKYNKPSKFKGKYYGVYPQQDENSLLVLRHEKANGQSDRISSFGTLKASKNFISKIGIHDIPASERPERIEEIQSKYSIQNRNMLLMDKGRDIGEKSVVFIKNGRLQGVGFIELNHQINNITILESLITPMESDSNTTFIIESYLRQKHRVKIIELNHNLERA